MTGLLAGVRHAPVARTAMATGSAGGAVANLTSSPGLSSVARATPAAHGVAAIGKGRLLAYGAAALGAAALVAGGVWYAGSRPRTYYVGLDSKPDFSSIAHLPDGPERQRAVYALIQEHFASREPAIRAELQAMQREGIISSFDGHAVANGFTASVRSSRRDEFEERMRATAGVGRIEQSGLSSDG